MAEADAADAGAAAEDAGGGGGGGGGKAEATGLKKALKKGFLYPSKARRKAAKARLGAGASAADDSGPTLTCDASAEWRDSAPAGGSEGADGAAAAVSTANPLLRSSVAICRGQRATCWMRDHGGIRGFDASVVTGGGAGGAGVAPHPARAIYFVSIIDLLQKYDLTKTMETKIKRGKSLKKGLLISSVPSAEYGDRFAAFMKEVIPDAAATRSAAEEKDLKKRKWKVRSRSVSPPLLPPRRSLTHVPYRFFARAAQWLGQAHDGLQGVPAHTEVAAAAAAAATAAAAAAAEAATDDRATDAAAADAREQ